MPHIKEQRLISSLKDNPNLMGIKVLTTTKNFEERFNGSIALFFRTLKNGLNSFHGVSNREYFKNISGCYFSLGESETFEIIILYDKSIKTLNQIEVATRVKKLLGLNTKVEFGDYSDFADRIQEMIGIVRKSQTFGDFYFNNKSAKS